MQSCSYGAAVMELLCAEQSTTKTKYMTVRGCVVFRWCPLGGNIKSCSKIGVGAVRLLSSLFTVLVSISGCCRMFLISQIAQMVRGGRVLMVPRGWQHRRTDRSETCGERIHVPE